jgi:hypothetical protein
LVIGIEDAAPPAQLGCTDVNSSDPMASHPMYPVPSSRPFADATANYDDQSKTLTVVVSGGAFHPDSRYAVAIHSGTCRQEGKTEFQLSALDTGRPDQAKATTILRNINNPPSTSGWSIVVSTAGDNIPTLCGDFTVRKA